MGTFNLFDRDTWGKVSVFDNAQTRIMHRVLGAISTRITDIQRLRNEILCISENTDCNFDYMQAVDLSNNNPEAFALMDIVYHYPNEDIKDALQTINDILSMWRNSNDRTKNWEKLAEHIKKLEPFFDKAKKHRLEFSKENVKNLCNVTVSGNAAWDLYIKNAKLIEILNEVNVKLKRQLERYDYDEYSGLKLDGTDLD